MLDVISSLEMGKTTRTVFESATRLWSISSVSVSADKSMFAAFVLLGGIVRTVKL